MISYTAELTHFDLRTQCYVTQDVLLDTLLLQIYDKLSREHNVSLSRIALAITMLIVELIVAAMTL